MAPDRAADVLPRERSSRVRRYGASFDRQHLPADWSSTDNALERTAFDFKDAPLVIDDRRELYTVEDLVLVTSDGHRLLSIPQDGLLSLPPP